MKQSIDKNKLIVYDAETIINLSTFCFLDFATKKKKEFVLFDDITQFYELIKFIKQCIAHNYTFVSFNGVNFDDQIIHKLLDINYEVSIEQVISVIYSEAQRVISLPDDIKFKEILHESKFKYNTIDLFLQKHYNRPAKATSLKWLQFSMRFANIEEMPIPHDQPIVKEQIPSILKYNWNDVESTEYFLKKIMFETDLRLSLSEKFKLNLVNSPEPKLARDIFAKYLCEEMKVSYSELKTMQTHHRSIKVKDIIFSYIQFNNPLFKGLLDTLNSTVLKIEDKFEKNLDVYGLNCTFALGGLHSNNKPQIVEEDEKHIIITSDVKSYYPNLAIENDLKPAHLGNTFSKIYKMIYNERGKYDKKDPMNYVFKILLNSTYGLSGEKNSYLYDVSFTRAICINGQLLLLKLAEMVKEQIPSAKFIMMNTDGLEVLVPKEYESIYFKVCEKWEKLTKLVLEHGQYKKMVIRDVNNYLSIDYKNDIKKKGCFETEMDFHKNPSFLVIPKALEAYFVNGVDYRKFIENNENIFDYLGAVKKKSNFNLCLYYMNEGKISFDLGQKVTRFYIAKNGKRFFKEFKDGRSVAILKNWNVEQANEINDSNSKEIRNNIDYKYYISEVEKLIIEIEGNKQQLQLF